MMRTIRGLFFDRYGTLPVCGGMDAAWQTHVHLDPEARPVLSALRTLYSLVLISDFNLPPHVEEVLASSGLAPPFDANGCGWTRVTAPSLEVNRV